MLLVYPSSLYTPPSPSSSVKPLPSAKTIAGSAAKSLRRSASRSITPRPTCPRCSRPPVQCLCSSLPPSPLPTQTKLVILQHPNEFRRKTFSTVPLLPLVLSNVEVVVGREFTSGSVRAVREAIDRGERPLLLFPGENSTSIDSYLPSSSATSASARSCPYRPRSPSLPRGRTVVLIDGTWTQARRMARLSPSLLSSCELVSFDEPSTSLYSPVRREPDGHCVSTLEAAGRALRLLESDEEGAKKAEESLLDALGRLVEVQLRFSAGDARRPRFKGGGASEGGRDAKVTPRTPDDAPFVQEGGRNAKVRPLKPDDAPFVQERWPFSDGTAKARRMIERQIEEGAKGGCCLGVEEGGELRAAILRYPKTGFLGMLHVDEEYRRKGYASELLARAEEALRGRGEER